MFDLQNPLVTGIGAMIITTLVAVVIQKRKTRHCSTLALSYSKLWLQCVGYVNQLSASDVKQTLLRLQDVSEKLGRDVDGDFTYGSILSSQEVGYVFDIRTFSELCAWVQQDEDKLRDLLQGISDGDPCMILHAIESIGVATAKDALEYYQDVSLVKTSDIFATKVAHALTLLPNFSKHLITKHKERLQCNPDKLNGRINQCSEALEAAEKIGVLTEAEIQTLTNLHEIAKKVLADYVATKKQTLDRCEAEKCAAYTIYQEQMAILLAQ